METSRTLTASLNRVVDAHPTRIAMFDTGRSGAPTVTYEQLAAEVDAVAGVLHGLGLERGDVLCNWLPNIREWMALQFAAARLGVLIVNLNTRFRSRELHDILSTTQAAAIVIPTGFLTIDFVGITREVIGAGSPSGWQDDWPHLRAVLGVDASSDPRAGAAQAAAAEHDLEVVDLASAAGAAGSPPSAVGGPDDPVDAFTTSGTTGAPKLATHTQRGVALHSAYVAEAFDLQPGDRMLAALPLCGVFGFSGSMAAILAGAGLVLQPAFDAGSAAAWFREAEITHAYGPDTMLRAIVDAAEDPDLLRSWRAGAFANFSGDGVAFARRVEASLGVRMRGVYGSSEVFGLMSIWPEEAAPEERHQGGGRPVSPDIAVRVTDPESGDTLPPGRDGEIQIRGYVVTAGYLGNEAASAAAFTDDGWFRTGDLGQVREDGMLIYHSRLGDSLRLGGYLVDPAEIEGHLLAHPEVVSAVVVGAQQAGVGDAAVAFVVAAAEHGLDEAGLGQYCRGQIAAFKIPTRIEFLDELPTVEGPNGVKIHRNELRQRAQQLLDRTATS